MSNENKNRYICKLPANGYQAGQEAFLTDAEVANFNGGEEIPRFVLAEEVSAADAPAPETPKEETPETPAAPADVQPETPATPETPAVPTPGGEYPDDEQKTEETPAAPAESTQTDPNATPASTEGVQ